MDHATSKIISVLLIVGGMLVVIAGFVLWSRIGHLSAIGFGVMASGLFLRSDSSYRSDAVADRKFKFAGICALILGLAVFAVRVAGL